MSAKPRGAMGSYFKSVLSWWTGAWAVAVMGPVALGLPHLEPPWPEGSSIGAAVLFSIVALAIARALFPPMRYRPDDLAGQARKARRLAIACFVGTIVMCVVYFAAFSTYVKGDLKREGDREWVLRRVVGDKVLHAEDAGIPPAKLLAENGYDEEQVWTGASLTQARLFVLCPFLATFFFLSLGLGVLGTLERLDADEIVADGTETPVAE